MMEIFNRLQNLSLYLSALCILLSFQYLLTTDFSAQERVLMRFLDFSYVKETENYFPNTQKSILSYINSFFATTEAQKIYIPKYHIGQVVQTISEPNERGVIVHADEFYKEPSKTYSERNKLEERYERGKNQPFYRVLINAADSPQVGTFGSLAYIGEDELQLIKPKFPRIINSKIDQLFIGFNEKKSEYIPNVKALEIENRSFSSVFVKINSKKDEKVFIGAPAMFGARLNETGISGEIILGNSKDGCSPFLNNFEIKDKIVVVDRGNCNFSKKAENAARAKAKGMIVINTKDSLFSMSSEEEDSFNLQKFSSILLSKSDSQILISEARKSNWKLTVTMYSK